MLGMAILLASCGTTKPVGQGQYRVARGDTLTKIAREHGQSVDTLIRLNKLKDGNSIRVGQVLNVRGGTATAPAPRASTNSPSIAAPRSIDLVWPAEGRPNRGSSAPHTQGVYIAGVAGSPVKAAAAGKVMYAGNGLRGYGNMLIVKHDADFLSVYAHNQTLLAKEGAQVRQGQTIATMGNTGSNVVNLYFELRYGGKAVDALRYLPKRSLQ
ncbi:peptidoglycan DD-metalloendopeptidase family protein [Pollutimonas sp. M17]|uniref:peptidoglycan DD-metalloendopeptidase family protein n=1 Tax=Pollutimonas sp. M17 TaxID=2962065 RepID=UPI0021F498DC|nr:peptidoglycan DD-metalloendopeptidase family protein [Pollutimonas sp. M17]UYO95550.1 peptidoglycan DD-metalloendopeptidase family protein [Pollutimonas sp. M17]